MESIAKVAAALVKAQKAFGPALKNSENPHFRSRYADLGACIDAVIGALNDQGIALMQRTKETDGGVSVETVLVHESGETWSTGWLFVPAVKNEPQPYGSALTYARRYSVMLLGVAPEDDDGNAANAAVATAKKTTDGGTMPKKQVADWLSSIETASLDELDGVIKAGLDAATILKDRDAYAVIRRAGQARRDRG